MGFIDLFNPPKIPCTHCGHENYDILDQTACPHCGAALLSRDKTASAFERPTNIPPATAPLTPQQAIEKQIRRAWIAALVSASMTLILVILSVVGVRFELGLNAWGLIDVLILAGFAFGIYRRSRVCAILLLAYAVFNEVYTLGVGLHPSPLRLIFLYFYFRAIPATFAYHRITFSMNLTEAPKNAVEGVG